MSYPSRSCPLILVTIAIACASGLASAAGDGKLPPGTGRASSPTVSPLLLRATHFDPLTESPKIPKRLKLESSQGYYLIQFTGRTKPEHRRALEALSVQLHSYIPNDAFIASMPVRIETPVRGLDFVRAVVLYHPAYKLDRRLWKHARKVKNNHKMRPRREGKPENIVELDVAMFNNHETRPRRERKPGKVVELDVAIFNPAANMAAVLAELLSLGGTITVEGSAKTGFMRTKIDRRRIRDIAFLPHVEWMEPVLEDVSLMNNIREYSGANTVHLDGYDGTGIVGGIKDNGLDIAHPDLQGQLLDVDGDAPEPRAHGTAVFGVLFGTGGGDPNATGMLPKAKGIFTRMGVFSVGTYESLENIATIWNGVFQSNSYGSGWNSEYTFATEQADLSVFDVRILSAFGAGNSGGGVGPQTLSVYAAAKNVIAVGALSHKDDVDRTNDIWGNAGKHNTPGQGPSTDGRVKPDLAGPWDKIFTTDATVCTDNTSSNNQPCSPFNEGYETNANYHDFGGTSGATPVVSGMAGLVYQMYEANHFGNNPGGERPQPSTVKALLINNAYHYDLDEQADRYQQGWGGADVGAVHAVGAAHLIMDEEEALGSGEESTTLVMASGTEPIRVSLVWTDVPGVAEADFYLKNNLDLELVAPSGDHYYGNMALLQSHETVPGQGVNDWFQPLLGGEPHRDNLNNVENVFIANPIAGQWKIRVLAPNVPEDGDPIKTPEEINQPFALVAQGLSLASCVKVVTVDALGSVGQYSAIAFGDDDLPIISYFAVQAPGDLKVAHCTDEGCNGATITTLDSDGVVGRHTSIAIGADDLPLISYQDLSNNNLKVAHCEDPSCSGGVTISNLGGGGNAGHFTSLAIGSDSLGLISFFADALKVAHCNDAACTNAEISLLDAPGGGPGSTGAFSSIAIGADGLGLISYESAQNGQLRVAHCNDISCSSAGLNILDAGVANGRDTSLAIGSDGLPFIAYFDASLDIDELKVAHCNELSCSTPPTITVLEVVGSIGGMPSVAIGSDGLPLVSYVNFAGAGERDLRVARCTNLECSDFHLCTVDAGYFSQPSIAIAPSNLPVISYSDTSSSNLKVARCLSEDCCSCF